MHKDDYFIGREVYMRVYADNAATTYLSDVALNTLLAVFIQMDRLLKRSLMSPELR